MTAQTKLNTDDQSAALPDEQIADALQRAGTSEETNDRDRPEPGAEFDAARNRKGNVIQFAPVPADRLPIPEEARMVGFHQHLPRPRSPYHTARAEQARQHASVSMPVWVEEAQRVLIDAGLRRDNVAIADKADHNAMTLAYALAYASVGLHVVDSYALDPKTGLGMSMTKEAKVPLGAGWQSRATTDPDSIKDFWTGNGRYPENKKGDAWPYKSVNFPRNVSIVLPYGCGLFVLDIDGEAGKSALAIDLDVRRANKAAEAWSALLGLCPNAKLLPSVVSGSGLDSRHLYFLTDAPYRGRNLARATGTCLLFDKAKGREVDKPDWEIDLKGTGVQVVLPPSIHPDTGLPYTWERPLELDFPAMMHLDAATVEGWGIVRRSSTDMSALLGPDPLPVDWNEVARALALITDADDRDTWLHIGMALHDASGGGDQGRDLWSEWSRKSNKFNERIQVSTWKGFKLKIGGKTIATLFQIATYYGWTPSCEVDGSDFEDMLATQEEVKPAKIGLIKAGNGDSKHTLHIAILVLKSVNQNKGFRIRRNEMTGQEEWRGGPINDADIGLIRVAVEQAGMHNVGADLTVSAVQAVAELNKYHPVKDWLGSLNHDGTPRLTTWLTRYLGAEVKPYTRAVGRAFLIAMAARVMQPGCKHDHVLVLGGAQGIGKSTACRILGGKWSGDNMPSIRDGGKEAGLYLKGHWLVEMTELAPSRKAENGDLKAFLSRDTDEIRAPYARKADIVQRQCVFVGTTNETAYQRDASGGRRFWPVTCGDKIAIDALAEDREQLFAEAVAAFRDGEAWYLSPDLESQAALEQEASREEHPWEQPIRRILEGLSEGDGFEKLPKDSVTIAELLKLLEIPVVNHPGKPSREVAAILRMFGWVKRRKNDGIEWARA